MISNSFLLNQVWGRIGKTMLIKHYADKGVVTKVPDMSTIEASPAQRVERNKFKEAVARARQTNNDPVLRVGYIKAARGSNKIYQYLLQQYLKKRSFFYQQCDKL